MSPAGVISVGPADMSRLGIGKLDPKGQAARALNDRSVDEIVGAGNMRIAVQTANLVDLAPPTIAASDVCALGPFMALKQTFKQHARADGPSGSYWPKYAE